MSASASAVASKRPRMRPVFEMNLPAPGQAVLDEIRRALKRANARVDGVVLVTQAELTTHRPEAHFWSPYLSVEVFQRDDGGWALKGRFAPEPNVWILFMGVYGILGMGALGGVMFGVSQWIVREPPWALVATPLCLALIGFTYGAAFIGQGLGAEEMYRLRSFIDDCVSAATRAAVEAADPQI